MNDNVRTGALDAVGQIIVRLDALETEKKQLLSELAAIRDVLPRLRRARKPKANGKPKRTRQPKPAPAPEPRGEG